MQRKKLISIDISLGSYDAFVGRLIDLAASGKSEYACVANVHMLIEAKRSDSFAEVVNNAALITPDGQPLTWALRILYGIRQERVAGMDLLPDLLVAAEKRNIPVGFYGGTETMIDKSRVILEKKHPGLTIAKMYSPPFRALTREEEDAVVHAFRESGAALIFVALGCPKQEKWMAFMRGKLNAVMVGVGGALPVLAQMQKRAPYWMQKSGLEWLYRLGQEPVRLFRRYANTNSQFVYMVLKEKLFPKKITSGEQGKNIT
jgi:N-acetylglucosaminyldiphosphoundecaprenol N-acetyl-beta-D-mannosaminyltransferase